MKKHIFSAIILVLLILSILGVGSTHAQEAEPPHNPVGVLEVPTAPFTYQGELIKEGSPVDGTCDMKFDLYDAATGTGHIGDTRTLTNVNVTEGRFTVQVYFYGSGEYSSGYEGGMFSYGERWLEIRVSCPAGSDTYITLSPRQQITPAPVAYALPGFFTRSDETSPNIIGGHYQNTVNVNSSGGVISGGGEPEDCRLNFTGNCYNEVTYSFGAIGGGSANLAGSYSVVGGGFGNIASGAYSFIGGGDENIASEIWATVGGGWENEANGKESFVGGGYSNVAGGRYATVPGGIYNEANGQYSFAAGAQAKANHDGSFVWADSVWEHFETSKNNQFLIRATGGVGIGTNDTLDNGVTVNGRVIAGGTATGVAGGEPFVARGSSSGISMDDRAGGTNPRWVVFPNAGSLNFWNGTNRLVVSGSGVVTLGGVGIAGSTILCRNTSNQISTCSSSARYKTNIAPLKMGLEVIEQLRPVTFDWKGSGEADLGLVAEEVNEISPLLTFYNEEGEIEGVKYDRISAVLVNAVQEQQDQIAALEARLAELEQGGTASVKTSPPANHWLILALAAIGILLVIVVAQGIFLRRLVFQQMNAREARNEA